MKRAILSVVVLAAALLIQLTVVNRLPLPGGGAPDLVLLAVVALGLCGGPAAGAITGFGAGLALDIAPPGSYLIGEYALVFCLIGYLCGSLRGAVSRSALLTIAVAMAAAAVGEAMSAAIGLAVSNPQVTWPAVREVLPSAIVYDAVLAPFVLYVVVRAVRLVDALGRPATGASQPADGSGLLARGQSSGALPRTALNGSAASGATVLGGAGLLGGAGWLSGPDRSRGPRMPRGSPRPGTASRSPRTPRLGGAAARHGDGWVGDAPRAGRTTSPRLGPARTPRLRPGSGSAGSAVARPARPLPRPPVNLRLSAAGRRHDGSVGRALGAGAAAAAVSRPKSGPPRSAFRGRRAGIDRPAALARPGVPRSAALSRGAFSRGPRFRPDPHLRGGSAGPDLRLGGSGPRVRPSRRVSLRLGNARRRDGVLGGSVLAGRARPGAGPRPAARPVKLRLGSGRRSSGPGPAARPVKLRLGSGKRGGGRGLAARPVNLRLGSGRRNGALGGLPGRRGPWARPRLGTSRRAKPRFRSGVAGGGRSALGGGSRLRAGKRVRFTGSSFLTTWTGGLLGGRSAAVWRLGRRTGGLR